MKKLITILLCALTVNSFGQSCGYPSAGGYTVPLYGIIYNPHDTVCWYWNRTETIAYVAANAGTTYSAGNGIAITSGTIALLQQGVTAEMSGGSITVTCASCTTNSIILVQEALSSGVPTGIAQIVVDRHNGSFDILANRGSSDGNKFMYQVFKY